MKTSLSAVFEFEPSRQSKQSVFLERFLNTKMSATVWGFWHVLCYRAHIHTRGTQLGHYTNTHIHPSFHIDAMAKCRQQPHNVMFKYSKLVSVTMCGDDAITFSNRQQHPPSKAFSSTRPPVFPCNTQHIFNLFLHFWPLPRRRSRISLFLRPLLLPLIWVLRSWLNLVTVWLRTFNSRLMPCIESTGMLFSDSIFCPVAFIRLLFLFFSVAITSFGFLKSTNMPASEWWAIFKVDENRITIQSHCIVRPFMMCADNMPFYSSPNWSIAHEWLKPTTDSGSIISQPLWYSTNILINGMQHIPAVQLRTWAQSMNRCVAVNFSEYLHRPRSHQCDLFVLMGMNWNLHFSERVNYESIQ